MTAASEDIRQDPTIQKLLSRMPLDVQQSFTEQQLAELRVALGARQWGKHRIDLRGTLSVWRFRYYYVFVAGRNVREQSRQARQLSMLGQAILISILLSICLLFGLLLLYLLKSALGIDLLDDYSFGIWHWFKSL
jgi:hypothetical protein